MVQNNGAAPRSIRLLNGDFYTTTWERVFVPLGYKDAQAFTKQVSEQEKRKGRTLTKAELDRIAAEVEHGSN